MYWSHLLTRKPAMKIHNPIRQMEHNHTNSWQISSRRDEMTIAQPFKVEYAHEEQTSPEGTAESLTYERKQNGTFSRPFGTKSSSRCVPNLERLGYSQSSLRDGVLRALVLTALLIVSVNVS